ncbi:MAG: hypothetical protein CMN30_14545 [Sandaracinus sp.]|nr:hypothetical protein [Sandaracinus sp.]MAQ15994.1 hypothetical protein [Sandaracinus sp.]
MWRGIPLIAACIAACGGPQDGGSAPATSIFDFPDADALQAELAESAPPRALFPAAPEGAAWEVSDDLPAAPALAGHELTTPAGLLVNSVAGRLPGVVASAGAGCHARELARYVAATGQRPPMGRERFVAARCGAVSTRITTLIHETSDPESVSDADVWAAHEGPARRWVEGALVGVGDALIGLHFARAGGRGALALVVEQPELVLREVRPEPDGSGAVVIRGRLLVEDARHVEALINVGDHGVRECEAARNVALPEVAFRCAMDPADEVAGIDVGLLREGRFLAQGVATLLARRGADAARRHRPTAVGPTARATNPGELQRLVLARVAELRREFGLGPLVHAEAETRALEPAARHYFWSGASDELRDQIALTMLAGWEVPGAIRDARLTASAMGTTDVAEWLGIAMDRPSMRAVFMDPEARYLAIASVVEAGGIGAIVTSYEDAPPAGAPATAATATALLDRITEVRVARGLEPPTEVRDPSALVRELERVREGKDPGRALEAAMARAAREWNHAVGGLTLRTGGRLDTLQVPEELLQPGPLYVQAAAIFHQAPGAPWGQYLVFMLHAR